MVRERQDQEKVAKSEEVSVFWEMEVGTGISVYEGTSSFRRQKSIKQNTKGENLTSERKSEASYSEPREKSMGFE